MRLSPTIVTGAIGQFGAAPPSLRAVVDIARVKTETGTCFPLPSGGQQHDGEEHRRAHLRPRPQRDITGRDRLGLAWPIGGGLPEAGRKRAVVRSRGPHLWALEGEIDEGIALPLFDDHREEKKRPDATEPSAGVRSITASSVVLRIAM